MHSQIDIKRTYESLQMHFQLNAKKTQKPKTEFIGTEEGCWYAIKCLYIGYKI